MLQFKKPVIQQEINEDRYNKAITKITLEKGHEEGGEATQKKVFSVLSSQLQKRTLDDPDYVYKGIFYSDGVVQSGVQVVPKINEITANATNLFKKCLFRVEIKQVCDLNQKLMDLVETRDKID